MNITHKNVYFGQIKISKTMKPNFSFFENSISRSGPEVPPFNYNGFLARVIVTELTTPAPTTTTTSTTENLGESQKKRFHYQIGSTSISHSKISHQQIITQNRNFKLGNHLFNGKSN